MRVRKKKIVIIISTIAIALLLVMVTLVLTKVVKVNALLIGDYSVRGIDVSHYQGDIDWAKLQEQDVKFAYIKATEGSKSVDDKFRENWEKSGETSMYVGAYHFFSFDSEGETQAQNYITTVGELSGKLVPAVDVEYYGKKEANPPQKEDVVRELKDMLEKLEENYGAKPIIYTTYKVYYKYIKDEFDDYPLWIRNVYFSPNVDLRGKWTLWQYSDSGVLEGYQGDEKYIDQNVFCGTEEELKELYCR